MPRNCTLTGRKSWDKGKSNPNIRNQGGRCVTCQMGFGLTFFTSEQQLVNLKGFDSSSPAIQSQIEHLFASQMFYKALRQFRKPQPRKFYKGVSENSGYVTLGSL